MRWGMATNPNPVSFDPEVSFDPSGPPDESSGGRKAERSSLVAAVGRSGDRSVAVLEFWSVWEREEFCEMGSSEADCFVAERQPPRKNTRKNTRETSTTNNSGQVEKILSREDILIKPALILLSCIE